MANLLLDTDIRANIETITGTIDDMWLEIAWAILIDELGYDPSFQEDIEEEKEGTDTRYIFLENRPVLAINSVYNGENELDIDCFSIYGEIGIKQDFSFLKTKKDYVINYDAGYTEETFPSSLIYAVSLMIQNVVNNSGEQGQLSSYKIDTISYNFKSFIEQNAQIQTILEKYRGF